MRITSLQQLQDQAVREAAFPVVKKRVFWAHAGVAVTAQCVADAMNGYTTATTEDEVPFDETLRKLLKTRRTCAEMIGAKSQEIALLGPTSLGLSLVANGLPWERGDEVVCYLDDYPANVYPWKNLERFGVKIVYIQPERPGEITPGLVAKLLTKRTKLVALASCHFFSGYRIDHDAIGKLVQDHGALFCLDAIQTIGAFETRVDHVDFLSADSHKWMMGPVSAGIVYVKEKHFDLLRPTLLGAWNVRSPNYISQDAVEFETTARRYEPGVLNCGPTFGMEAALEMMLAIGQNQISQQLLNLKSKVVAELEAREFQIIGPKSGLNTSSITTFTSEKLDMELLHKHLAENAVSVSLRHDRSNKAHIRFSPHFYNTEAELERILTLIDQF
ncbi:MAG: aminotransferase class V-fold PLP-dependent enzyme [Verrucomicrobiota bacterium]